MEAIPIQTTTMFMSSSVNKVCLLVHLRSEGAEECWAIISGGFLGWILGSWQLVVEYVPQRMNCIEDAQ